MAARHSQFDLAIADFVVSLTNAFPGGSGAADHVHLTGDAVLHEGADHHLAGAGCAAIEQDNQWFAKQRCRPALVEVGGQSGDAIATGAMHFIGEEELVLVEEVLPDFHALFVAKLEGGKQALLEEEAAAFHGLVHSASAIAAQVENHSFAGGDFCHSSFYQFDDIFAIKTADAQIANLAGGEG